MKRLLLILTLALFVAGCNDVPSARVRNRLPGKVNVSFQPTSGNTLNINDVAPGTVSGYIDVPEGMLRIHASTSGTNPDDVNHTFVKGNRYTVQVDTGATPSMTVIQD
ncbi:MAG: DUF4397 domain-containing protein [Candidatus Eisenbacteria bacterium]|nr:DUF4397 domain-containing protein [Candidatus Eisenbacteria bacterium]